MLLYGPTGDLLESSDDPETSRERGWREGGPGTLTNTSYVYGVNRDDVRRRTRRAFFTNELFGTAVEIAAALLIGDEFSYGELNMDRAGREVLDGFWTENDLAQLLPARLVTEYLLDGELCAVFPPEAETSPDLPAPIVHLDMDRSVRVMADITGPHTVETTGADGRTLRWSQGEFVFTAHNALWNDPRGWPVAMRAVGPAEAYLTLLQHRLNTHDLQGRILGVQTVFVDRNDPHSRAAFEAKRGAYRSMPRRGGILTLAKVEGKDGQVISDEINFMTPAAGAANAQADARNFVRLTALAILGMPEHYLGEGGAVTRTTADSMTLPAIRGVKRIHAALRRHLDRLFRLELQRRHGPDRLYSVSTYEVQPDGVTRKRRTKRVRASQIEVPWVFPQVTQDNLADLITRAEAAARNGWASPQSLSASLGFDPAAEAELMAAAGRHFGQPDPTAARPAAPPTPGGDPNAEDPTPEPPESA